MLGDFFIVDIAVIAVMILSTILACVRGFFRELLSILSWIGAIVIAVMFHSVLEGYLLSFAIFKDFPNLAKIGGFVGIFVVALLVFTIISALIAGGISRSMGTIDKTLGFVYGVLRGALIISAFFLGYKIIAHNTSKHVWVENAVSKPYAEYGANLIEQAIPQKAYDYLHRFLGKFNPTGENAADSDAGNNNNNDNAAPGEDSLNPDNSTITDPSSQNNDTLLDQLTNPPVEQAIKEEPEGYNNKQRQNLDRVIDAVDQNPALQNSTDTPAGEDILDVDALLRGDTPPQNGGADEADDNENTDTGLNQ